MSIEKVKVFKVDGELREKPPITATIDAWEVDGKLYESRYEAAQEAVVMMTRGALKFTGVERCFWDSVIFHTLSMIESEGGKDAIKAYIEELEK